MTTLIPWSHPRTPEPRLCRPSRQPMLLTLSWNAGGPPNASNGPLNPPTPKIGCGYGTYEYAVVFVVEFAGWKPMPNTPPLCPNVVVLGVTPAGHCAKPATRPVVSHAGVPR